MKNKDLLTVGELAKLMDITVRTLQYYDQKGLLTPSCKSEGGRRLYTKKDMVKLHQILSFKYLGFCLEDIKDKLISLDNPNDVVKILNSHEQSLKSQIEKLTEEISAVQSLRDEVLLIHEVDFNKYADIITLIRQNNEGYWVFKFFDDTLMTHIKDRFTNQPDSGLVLFKKWKNMCDEVVLLSDQQITPGSNEGQELAKQWWSLIIDFTGGDMNILPKLKHFNETKHGWSEEIQKKQQTVDDFIGKALEIYFQTSGKQSPFGEVRYNGTSNKS
ncbi:MerR family transcriptional regulator [Microbacteriaceae bacterium 4G12]